MKRRTHYQQNGFSQPELLTCSLLLTIVVVNSATIHNRSLNTTQSSKLRDATYSLIAKDLEDLRGKSWRFACEGLTDEGEPIDPPPIDFPSGSCTGLVRDSGNPLSYKTGRPTPIAPFNLSCSSNNLGALLVEKFSLPDKDVKYPLPWNNLADAKLPSEVKTVTVLRSIIPTRNELKINYETTSDSSLDVKLTSIIVPQAAAFCP